MKETELRIGNYILSVDNQEGIVISLAKEGVGIKISDLLFSYEFYEKVKPIPLTEEWLIKLNFRKSNEKLYFLPIPLLYMEIHATFFRNQWLIELSNDRKNIVTECLTLHQLQNLYFALTGEELTLTDS